MHTVQQHLDRKPNLKGVHTHINVIKAYATDTAIHTNTTMRDRPTNENEHTNTHTQRACQTYARVPSSQTCTKKAHTHFLPASLSLSHTHTHTHTHTHAQKLKHAQTHRHSDTHSYYPVSCVWCCSLPQRRLWCHR